MTADAVAAFSENKQRIFAIAYRMLGTVADAEDMAQETFLRWQKSDRAGIKSAEAWLSTVVTRLCINHLKSARAQRQQYVGPWLPEPIVEEQAVDPRENAEQSDSLSIAFLVVLESLSPVERAVYLLREVFAYEFSEIARIVEKSEANCRQLLTRARQHVAERRPRFKSTPAQQERAVKAFLRATADGDLAALMSLLSENVAFVSDGGAGTRAVRRPVFGADNVSRLLLHEGAREKAAQTTERLAIINGQPGFVAFRGAEPHAAITFDTDGDRIATIYLVVNPAKLRRIALRMLPLGSAGGPLSSEP